MFVVRGLNTDSIAQNFTNDIRPALDIFALLYYWYFTIQEDKGERSSVIGHQVTITGIQHGSFYPGDGEIVGIELNLQIPLKKSSIFIPLKITACGGIDLMNITFIGKFSILATPVKSTQIIVSGATLGIPLPCHYYIHRTSIVFSQLSFQQFYFQCYPTFSICSRQFYIAIESLHRDLCSPGPSDF